MRGINKWKGKTFPHSSFISFFSFHSSISLKTICDLSTPWSTFLSIIFTLWRGLLPLFPFVFNSLFKCTLSFHLIFPYSQSPISCFVFSTPFFSYIAPHFKHSVSLAYVSYCFSIHSSHRLSHLWHLLLSSLPSSPVINCCYQDSSPKKCQHGSVVVPINSDEFMLQ